MPAGPPEPVEASPGLLKDERAVWDRQAPHAIRQGTLTPSTRGAFERYCRIAVLEANEAKSSGVGGPNHRGLLKLVNELELQFLLTANGRIVMDPSHVAPASSAPAPAAVNPLAKFRG